MRGPFLLPTAPALLGLGAALMLASCAAPRPRKPLSRPAPSRASPRSTGRTSSSPPFRTRPSPITASFRTIRKLAGRGPSSTSTTTAGSAIRRRAAASCGKTRPITTAPCCSPRRRPSIRAAPGRHHRLLPRQHGDAPARRHRPPADRAPARRLGPQRRARSPRSSRSTRPTRAPGDSGRRAASPPSSTRRRASSATSIPTRAAPSGGCRSSSSPTAAATCRPSIR